MAIGELEATAAATWAEALGCDLRLLSEPGGHLVLGGGRLRDLNGVYIAALGAAVLVYCPGWMQPRAAAMLASARSVSCSRQAFTPGSPASKKCRCSDRRGTGSPTPRTSCQWSAAPGGGWTVVIRCWPGCGRRAGRPNGLRAGSPTRTA